MRNRIGGDGGIGVPEYVTGKCPPHFGFPANRLREVHQNPDQAGIVMWDDLEVRMFLQHAPKYTDVVAIKWSPLPRLVAFALRAFPSLCATPLSDLAPLQLVEKMAEKFGLEVAIGAKKGKFFLREKVAIPAGASTGNLVQVANPNNHDFAQAFFLKVTPPVISIGLAFCLDTKAYGDWLKNH